MVNLFKLLRLPCGGQDGAPPRAGRIEALGVSSKQLDRNMDEPIVEEADDEAGLAGHRSVDGVAREEVAEDVVLTVCGPAADLVARIKIAHDNGNTLGFEVRLDSLAQKRADILQLNVARGVTRRRVRLQEILPGAFGDRDHSVRFCEHSLL